MDNVEKPPEVTDALEEAEVKPKNVWIAVNSGVKLWQFIISIVALCFALTRPLVNLHDDIRDMKQKVQAIPSYDTRISVLESWRDKHDIYTAQKELRILEQENLNKTQEEKIQLILQQNMRNSTLLEEVHATVRRLDERHEK